MKRLVLAIVASAIAAACSGSTPAGPGPIAAGSTSATEKKPDGVPKNWLTHLVGTQEVPSRETPAHGVVKYQLSPDGTELRWHLNASNIDNVFMAHIHCCVPAGSNAGIVLWLFAEPATPQPLILGPQNGFLSSGVATRANLVGSLAGRPLSDLIDQMVLGRTYTNVHTNNGVAPTNQGPGDFPGGEIRGQNEPAGNQ